MMAYFDSVRRQTLSYLNGLSQPDLESCPDPKRRPGYTVARMLAHLIVKDAQHTGQVAYIRRIQRGLGRLMQYGVCRGAKPLCLPGV